MVINDVMWLMFAGDSPIQHQTQDRHPSTVSEISNEDSGTYVAASDYPTPVESVSVSYVNSEQVVIGVMSETVTLEPISAITSHQVVSSYVAI